MSASNVGKPSVFMAVLRNMGGLMLNIESEKAALSHELLVTYDNVQGREVASMYTVWECL
jgi:hypothetical protein